MTKLQKYWKLFTSTFYLSAFVVGGGFVIVPLMQKKFVEELGWLEKEEMLDITAIAQSSPGVIAVNTSILVGYKIGGLLGTLIAIAGTLLPPLIIVSIISYAYSALVVNPIVSALLHGMQAGVAAVICEVALSLVIREVKAKHALSYFIMPTAFIAVFFFNINIAIIILSSIALSIIAVLVTSKKRAADLLIKPEGLPDNNAELEPTHVHSDETSKVLSDTQNVSDTHSVIKPTHVHSDETSKEVSDTQNEEGGQK